MKSARLTRPTAVEFEEHLDDLAQLKAKSPTVQLFIHTSFVTRLDPPRPAPAFRMASAATRISQALPRAKGPRPEERR